MKMKFATHAEADAYLNTLLRELAPYLKDLGWEPYRRDGNPAGFRFVYNPDCRFSVRVVNPVTGARLNVSGSWPSSLESDPVNGFESFYFTPAAWLKGDLRGNSDIGISCDRPAKQVAREIIRRFLPTWKNQWFALAEVKSRIIAQRAATVASRQRLAELFVGLESVQSAQPYDGSFPKGATSEVTLHLTDREAKAVADLLRQIAPCLEDKVNGLLDGLRAGLEELKLK